MSGPTTDETICYNNAEEMAMWKTVRKLRELADYVEDPYMDWEEVEEPEVIAELLRLKADKIESYLKAIGGETQSDNFKRLLKSIQWTRSCDYGPESIQEAWEEYTENQTNVTIEVDK